MASSSSTPPPSPRKYEVFLSFRGEDTRNNFVSHLYKALDDKGIVTYMDDQNLEKGDSISSELLKAIEESKFAIVVFSKDYASSRWCLDELVKIMKCRTEQGQIVIPIFYDVDPSDVRNQKNSFAKSLAQHEVKYKEKVQIWKQTLFEAAGLTGEDIRGRNEASCIKKIAEDVLWKLPLKASAKGLVGIESRMAKIESLLFRELGGVRFLGIWGMGGIGKTTIARAVFGKHIRGFEGGCFLPNVRKGEMVELQSILLSKVLKVDAKISDEYEGSRVIEQRLCSKKVLLVLDDVDDIKQLESLAGAHYWFGSGSRIIITTRDKHSVNELDVDQTYAVDLLSASEAIELFRWHAFKQNPPPEDFVHLSHRVVSYAAGLPLALEVLGSHLRGRRIPFWRSTLDRLKDAPQKGILTTLQISFEGLSDIEKDIFLDIACFFRGDLEDEVKRKLDIFGFYPEEGIIVLVEKSLIRIVYGRIQMHDLIQEMGQHIVRQEANNEPGRFSRLWLQKDIVDVLTYNTATTNIEGVVLSDGRNEQEIRLSKGVFRKMSKLRLLEIRQCKFFEAPDYLPHTLRWLRWDFYLAKSFPNDFESRNLVYLNLSRSKILRTPNFKCMPYLEVLDLTACKELLEVDPSIGVLKKLAQLVLEECEKLERLPSIDQMESLKLVNLSNCKEFRRFPDLHKNMSRLRILNLAHSNIEELPSTLGCLTNLQELRLSCCCNLRALPSSLLCLEYLEELDLHGCLNLPRFHGPFISMTPAFSILPLLRTLRMSSCNLFEPPEGIGWLPSLQELYLNRNFFSSLPESINCLTCLRVLDLWRCKMLYALPELPSSIQELVLFDCVELTAMPNLVELLHKYEDLRLLVLGNCWKLVQCSLSNSALRQSVPQFLSAFWDWGCMSNVLRTRREVLEVFLPWSEMPDWFYQITGHQLTLILSSSSYNDKLRGFALFIKKSDTGSSDPGGITFLYIPIGRVTSGGEWKEQNDCCLFEVIVDTRRSVKWGICLVRKDEVYKEDNSDLGITTHDPPNKEYDDSRLKIFAAQRDRQDIEVFLATGNTPNFEAPTFRTLY